MTLCNGPKLLMSVMIPFQLTNVTLLIIVYGMLPRNVKLAVNSCSVNVT